MLETCLGDLNTLGPGGLPALMAALFLAGLAGGATHCAGMCAPFIFAQMASKADGVASGGRVARLAGAALLPYHLGRGIGYSVLGAFAGGFAGAIAQASVPRYLLAALLVVASALMLAQASRRVAAWVPRMPALRLPPWLARRLTGLLAAPSGARGVLLGIALSALPCGLLYGALAGAAAAGSALGGALAMAAFVLGTMPALVGVAMAGRLFGRRHGPALAVASVALFAINAAVLATMAVRLASS
jgi:uncharacterized protein